MMKRRRGSHTVTVSSLMCTYTPFQCMFTVFVSASVCGCVCVCLRICVCAMRWSIFRLKVILWKRLWSLLEHSVLQARDSGCRAAICYANETRSDNLKACRHQSETSGLPVQIPSQTTITYEAEVIKDGTSSRLKHQVNVFTLDTSSQICPHRSDYC